MLTMLTAAGLRWMEQQRRRAALRNLLSYDDNLLEDMGYRRAEIERALRLPPETDALRHARAASTASLKLDHRK